MGQAGAHTTWVTTGASGRRASRISCPLQHRTPLGAPAVCASSSDLGTQALRPAPCALQAASASQGCRCVCVQHGTRTHGTFNPHGPWRIAAQAACISGIAHTAHVPGRTL